MPPKKMILTPKATKSSGFVRVAPLVDWDLEVDFVYNEYLHALMIQDIIETDWKAKEVSVDNQLSSKGEELAEIREKADRLDEDLEEFELKTRLRERIDEVKVVVDTVSDVLSPDVEETVNGLVSVLERARDCLHLENVRAFKSEEEMRRFVGLLGVSKKGIENIMGVIPEARLCERQVSVLTEFKDLEAELLRWDRKVSSLDRGTGNLTLRVLSDKLTDFQRISE